MREGEGKKTHQEGRAGPDEGRAGVEVGGVLKHPELLVADREDLLLERQLPRVQLQHL